MEGWRATHVSNLAPAAGRHLWAVAAGLALAALSACVSAPTPTSLPNEYLGRWYYVGSSGGIAGRGMGDEATGYVVIRADNTMQHHDEDDTLVSTTVFTVSRGPTIFSTEDQWILTVDGASPEAIMLSDGRQRMSRAENVYDGFVRAYARSR